MIHNPTAKVSEEVNYTVAYRLPAKNTTVVSLQSLTLYTTTMHSVTDGQTDR